MPTSSSPTLDAKVERMRRAAAQRDGTATPPPPLPAAPVAERVLTSDHGNPSTIATRQWRLTGYDKATTTDATVVHESTCVGDRNLDDALRALEARSDVRRITVTLA